MRVAYYGRVSTDREQYPHLSIPGQLENCKRKLFTAEDVMVSFFWDIESGSKSLEARGQGADPAQFNVPTPRDGGIRDLLDEVRSRDKRFEAVAVEEISRLGRKEKVVYDILEELEKYGVELWVATLGRIQGYMLRLILGIMISFGRMEREQFRERAQRGRIESARQGFHNGGKILYGYRFEETDNLNPKSKKKRKRLVPDPIQAKVVQEIFESYVYGGLGLNQIVTKLNSDPALYPPPQSHRSPLGHWSQSSIYSILHNPKYLGYQVWNIQNHQMEKRAHGPRNHPPDEWIWSSQPTHEALISRELFEAVREVGQRRERCRVENKARNAKREYLLRGLLTCGACGRRLQARFSEGRIYYVCAYVWEHGKSEAEKIGHPPKVSLREKDLKETIDEVFYELLFAPNRLTNLKRELSAMSNDQLKEQESKIRIYRSQLERIEKEMQNLVAGLSKAEVEPDHPFAILVKENIEKLDQEKRKVRVLLKAEMGKNPQLHSEGYIKSLFAKIPDLSSVLSQAPLDKLRKLYESFGLHGTYLPDSDTLALNLTVCSPLNPHVIGADDGVKTDPHLRHENVDLLGAEGRNRTGTGYSPTGF